jgi:type II secretion system protein N
MKKILIVLASALLTIFLTLFFFLTPGQIISIINTAQHKVVFSAGQSDGNYVTGYRFTNAVFAGYDGTKLLVFDEVLLDLHLLPLFLGRIGIDIHSKGIAAALSAGFDGSVNGEAIFSEVPFDTATFISPANVSFTAPVSGRVIVSGEKADIEVRADEITWKRLSVSGFDLPSEVFEKVKGGMSVERGNIAVKSLAFEGSKGYARLSGEIINGQRRLILELFPNDWNDPMLVPFERYKISPGQYKMPVDL